MNDDPVVPPAPEVTAETVAIRRRWLSLGEAVAVAGVIIGGLTFWNSFEERRDAREIRAEERAAAREAALAASRRTGLIATEADGSTIAFKGVDCALQSADIRFPKALGVAAQSTVTVHEIEAAWIARPLLQLTDGGEDRRQGRLPVLIDSLCTGSEGNRQESAIYDIAWRIEPGLFGRSLKLRGMVMRQRVTGSGGQETLDALWIKP